MTCIDGTLAHHWQLEPIGLTVAGTCSRCKAERLFNNRPVEDVARDFGHGSARGNQLPIRLAKAEGPRAVFR